MIWEGRDGKKSSSAYKHVEKGINSTQTSRNSRKHTELEQSEELLTILFNEIRPVVVQDW